VTAGPALELVDLRKRFGAVCAVDGVTLALAPGETLGLVGPNGAGKTTVVDLAAGFVRGGSGAVRLDGADVGRLAPHSRATRGLVRSFQDAQLFATLTVEEVVRLAVEQDRARRGAGGRTRALLAQHGLSAYAATRVCELSTGTRRIVELTVVVALEPRVLLLDEPSAGLAHDEVDGLAELLAGVRARVGAAMLVVEHDLRLVAALSDRLAAMVAGRIVAEGTPGTVLGDAAVADALGVAPPVAESVR
jgi:ABC-type branched-subunit amino acid transport system ATPase component